MNTCEDSFTRLTLFFIVFVFVCFCFFVFLGGGGLAFACIYIIFYNFVRLYVFFIYFCVSYISL